jgi:hypothetical protein
MKTVRPLSVSGLLIVLTACGSSGEGDGSGEAGGAKRPSKPTTTSNLEMMPQVSYLDAKKSNDALLRDDSMIFPAAGNEDLLKKKAGDVLIGDRRTVVSEWSNNTTGFMRKVVSVTNQNGTIVVKTETARLEDVIFRGKFQAEAEFEDLRAIDDDAVDVGALPGASPQGTGSVGVDLGFGPIDLSLIPDKKASFSVTGAKGKAMGVDYSIKAKLSKVDFHFRPRVTIGAEVSTPEAWSDRFNPGNYLESFVLQMDGQLVAALVGSLEGELKRTTAEADYGPDIAQAIESRVKNDHIKAFLDKPIFKSPSIAGPPIPTPLGPIPTTLSLEIKVKCEEEVSFGGAVELGFESTNTAKMGAKYQRGTGWTGISGLTVNNKIVGPNYTLSGGYEMKCELSPTFKWKIADVAGPTASVGVYGKYGVKYEEECKQARNAYAKLSPSAEAGLTAKVGGVVEISKFTLAEFQYDLFDKKLIEAPFTPIDLGNAHSFGRCVDEAQGGQGGTSSGQAGTGGTGGTSSGKGGTGGSGSGKGGTGGTGGAGGSSAGEGGNGGTDSGGTGGTAGSQGDVCGDGIVGSTEGCDGENFDGATCETTTGYTKGTLKCTPECGIDTSDCNLGADCSHPTSEKGGPLLITCDACTQQICEVDMYCCLNTWDFSCVYTASTVCGQ